MSLFMEVYKIRRLSDGLYYRGKSKFTKYGTFFRMEQIMANISWVKTLEKEIELVSYEVNEIDTMVVDWDLSQEDLVEILERDEKIKKIIG